MKDSEKAAEIRQRLAQNPNVAEDWFELGMQYFDDEFEQACACFSRALHLEPFCSKYYFNRGRKCLSLDRFEDALADFEMVLRLDPMNDDSWHYVGVAYYFLGLYGHAVPYFTQSLAVMVEKGVPLLPPTVDWIWMCHMRMGDKVAAQKILDDYITPDIPVDESDFDYKKRVLLYTGHTPPEKFEAEIDAEDDVKGITETYALAIYNRYVLGDMARYRQLLQRVLDYKTFHHAFAYKQALREMEALDPQQINAER